LERGDKKVEEGISIIKVYCMYLQKYHNETSIIQSNEILLKKEREFLSLKRGLLK
jgi:hypothetical protein